MQNQQEVSGEVPRGYELERLEYAATRRGTEVAAVTMTVALVHGRDAAVALIWWMVNVWVTNEASSILKINMI